MLKNLARRARAFLLAPLLDEPREPRPCAVTQLTLSAAWRLLAASGGPLPTLAEVGFRAHSQHEEDGILLYLFSLLGMHSRRSVEIGAGDGVENNTANLILNHRFVGLLVDGDPVNARKARAFYAAHPGTRFWPPVVRDSWITAENVNDVISDAGFEGDVDLFSLDLDGVDYWVWKALGQVSPRVVVAEVNHLWGTRASVTVPYAADFRGEFTEHGSDYAGASLPAFVELGREKGYRLVGCNAFATNAFFVRNDVEHPALPEIDPATCFDHPRARFGTTERFEGIKDREWVEV